MTSRDRPGVTQCLVHEIGHLGPLELDLEVERVPRLGDASAPSGVGCSSRPRRRAHRRQTLRAMADSQARTLGLAQLSPMRHASSRVSCARSSAACRSPETAAHSRTRRARSRSRHRLASVIWISPGRYCGANRNLTRITNAVRRRIGDSDAISRTLRPRERPPPASTCRPRWSTRWAAASGRASRSPSTGIPTAAAWPCWAGATCSASAPRTGRPRASKAGRSWTWSWSWTPPHAR